MTVGRSLDEASLALSRALARLRAIDTPSLYEAAATVAARDHLYRQLARIVDLTLGEPRLTQRPVTADAMTGAVADAVALLGSDAGRPTPKTTLLATGIAAAAISLPIPNPAVLKADGTAAAAIEAAAEALSLAAEIIATHRHPMAWPRPPRRRGALADLTAEGSAIALGAQRKEITGEIARLALDAIKVDQRLLSWRAKHPDVLSAHQWEAVAAWVASDFGAVFAALSQAGPPTLLRELIAAPASERHFGPHNIQAWSDAAESVAAARTALKRQPELGVVAIAAATARLGFAVTAASWRISGRRHPHPKTVQQGDMWRDLATATSRLADVRDAAATDYVTELDWARNWIRQTTAGRTTVATPQELQQTIRLERQIRGLCKELSQRIRQAATAGHLLTNTAMVLDTVTSGPIVLAVPSWAKPEPGDRVLAEALHALQTATESRTSSTIASAVARHRETPEPAAEEQSNPAAQSRMSLATVQQLRRYLQRHDNAIDADGDHVDGLPSSSVTLAKAFPLQANRSPAVGQQATRGTAVPAQDRHRAIER